MSTDRDVTRTVRSWLEEGVTALPDAVLDTVLDQLPATPQRRAGWLGRRLPEMNNTAKIAMAAAAVLVVAFIGLRFLGPGQNLGDPGPTPIPTALPLPSIQGAWLRVPMLPIRLRTPAGGAPVRSRAGPTATPPRQPRSASRSPSRRAGPSSKVTRMCFG